MAQHDKYLYGAILVALVFHGSLVVYSFESTYDAYVHLFFASHYAHHWFESWSQMWYTGFNVTSYPPLVHQVIALFSYIVGLKGAFILWSSVIIALFVRGLYRFSEIFVPQYVLKYVAMVAPFSFSFTEALHIFGQLPSITGVTFLLNACPLVYKWFRTHEIRYFAGGVALLALTTTAHHVTTIFGMVFFILPLIGTAVLDNTAQKHNCSVRDTAILDIVKEVWQTIPRAVVFGCSVIALTILVLLPYWLWSKSDPISQIPIPHGSRANFIEELNLGLVFFLIPWGMMLFALPYLFMKFFQRRLIFFGLSFLLAFLLGTGGTTPIPKMLLGQNAFDILTLDRFTFWATLMAVPLYAHFLYDLVSGSIGIYLRQLWRYLYSGMIIFFAAGTVICTGLIVNLGYFRPLQPAEIDIVPIVNFLERDDHSQWRFLTLGFGDQMAWLSANTAARSVDGNYHSARRLPELTSRAVERLENAKYLGKEGLGALHQFLTIPDKYNLKYIFSNDKFYEPLLFFSGWNRLGPLENNIVVWERPDVPPLPKILPGKSIPTYQRFIWGVMPLTTLLMVCIIYLLYFKLSRPAMRLNVIEPDILHSSRIQRRNRIYVIWIAALAFFITAFVIIRFINDQRQVSPQNVIYSYFNALDYKFFTEAYTLLDPLARGSEEEYNLKLSLNDGLLASYAKLDSVIIEKIEITNDKKAYAEVRTTWLTSVSHYVSMYNLELIRHQGKWYIVPDDQRMQVPPEQYYRLPEISFRNQGRRSTTFGRTSHDDLIDRPHIVLQNVRLIRDSDHYYIVGRMVNQDVDPAYITLKGILYDDEDKEMAQYNVRDIGKHQLLPRQSTAFRIDFEETIWSLPKDRYDPTRENLKSFKEKVSNFAVIANAVALDQDIYVRYAIEDVIADSTDKKVLFNIYNYGTQDINIPQIISEIYQDDALIWVDNRYLDQGIRAQRNMRDLLQIPDISHLETIETDGKERLMVNGKPQIERYMVLPPTQAIRIAGSQFINLDVNPFVNALNN